MTFAKVSHDKSKASPTLHLCLFPKLTLKLHLYKYHGSTDNNSCKALRREKVKNTT